MIKTPTGNSLFSPLMTADEIACIQGVIKANRDDLKIIVELGTYTGGTTIAMSEVVHPEAIIYTVDCFVINRDSIRDKVVENLKNYANIQLLEMTTMQAAHRFIQPIDLLFIDADHQDDSILRDISSWLPKLKRGGILIADDYNNDYFPAVKRRVDEQTQQWKVIAEVDTIKIFQKP